VLEPADTAAARAVGPALTIVSIGFILIAIGQTLATWSIDLVEGRRRLRAFIVIAAALDGTVHALLQLLVYGNAPSDLASAANALVLALIAGIAALGLTRVGGDLFARALPETAVAAHRDSGAEDGTDPADRKLIAGLTRLMATDRLYRQEDLTIGRLASRLGIPEYRLRRLINGTLGYRNFNVFLNSYRIGDAKSALADPDQATVPITTIALDAGFQSLGPFNRAFKTETGLTPSEYRRVSATAR
jgi:AraC-like DNA-binding protein